MRIYFLPGEKIEFVSLGISKTVSEDIVNQRLYAHVSAGCGREMQRVRQSVIEEVKWRNVDESYADKVRVQDDSIILPEKKSRDRPALHLMTDKVAFFARFKDRTGLEGYRFIGVYRKKDKCFVRESKSLCIAAKVDRAAGFVE